MSCSSQSHAAYLQLLCLLIREKLTHCRIKASLRLPEDAHHGARERASSQELRGHNTGSKPAKLEFNADTIEQRWRSRTFVIEGRGMAFRHHSNGDDGEYQELANMRLEHSCGLSLVFIDD